MRGRVTNVRVHGCYQVQHGCSDILTCVDGGSCMGRIPPAAMEASMDEMRERWAPP